MGLGPTSADVPGAYDLVIAVNGGATTGYLYDDALESSLPFRTHRATYTYTPTFIERTNVSGDYGDNQQDFFLTATQRDWSLGEQQRYFRANDGESSRRYWDGQNVNVSRAGEVSIRPGLLNATLAAAAVCIASEPIGLATASSQIGIASSANLYTIDDNRTITAQGAHGLGAAPSLWGICSDGARLYISCNRTDSAASVGVRKWTGAAFSTWSATGVDTMAFLNNTLHGLDWSSGNLYRFDTAGVATSVFQWKDASGGGLRLGNASALASSKLFPFGSKLGILLVPNQNNATTTCSLWLYDGTGVSEAASFPGGFLPYDVCVAQGVIYISGTIAYKAGRIPIIYYYANGGLGVHWKLEPPYYVTDASAPAMIPWESGFAFTAAHSASSGADTAGTIGLNYYNAQTGGSSNLVAGWSATSTDLMALAATGASAFAILPGSTTVSAFQDKGDAAAAAYLKTSLIDFDSGLTKLFRGITVEFDSATDGDGGTVAVAYRTDLDGSYSSFVAGITSGAENLLTGVSGRALSVKVRLSKSTSTYGPKLRKVLVRAAPVLNRYPQREYVLDCSGNPGTNNKRILRNGDTHPLSGREQVDTLITAAEALKTSASSYLTITDRLGSYTGIIDSLEVYEEHPSTKANAGKSGSFTVKIVARGI